MVQHLDGSTPYPYLSAMPINPTQSVRKLVAFRRTKFSEIDKFRSDLGLKGESEAVRRLIDAGLELYKNNRPKPSDKG
jgi:hypothetical protein